MRRTFRVRPSLSHLESRCLLTAMPYPDPFRTAVAVSYASQAQTATNPVVLLGDSITYNWGSSTRSAPGSSVFDTSLASIGTANFGIAGDTTANLLYRVQTGELAGQPKVAVVMIGVNDLIGGATPEATAAGISSVVQAIQAESPRTQVLLLSVLPTDITAINGKIAQVDSMIAGLARTPNVTYLDLEPAFLGSNGIARPSLLKDLVHPDALGYQVIAGSIDITLSHLLNPLKVTTGPSNPAPVSTSRVVTIPTIATSSVLIPISTDSGSSDPSSPTSPTHHKSTPNDIQTVRII